jgi:hypothetical protein
MMWTAPESLVERICTTQSGTGLSAIREYRTRGVFLAHPIFKGRLSLPVLWIRKYFFRIQNFGSETLEAN